MDQGASALALCMANPWTSRGATSYTVKCPLTTPFPRPNKTRARIRGRSAGLLGGTGGESCRASIRL
jgi:hypothetical protein